MAFIDELTIFAKAGKGGDGVVRWRHEKGKEKGGPAGGDGGKGGNVYAFAVRDVHLLFDYKHKKDFAAQAGEDGKKNSLEGADGEDLLIKLPVGSIITNNSTNETIRLNEEGQKELLLKGGRRGRGNESFKSSTNTTPQESTPGTEGEEAEFFIEVELIADVGLIGFPNAGKTSLLNELTSAHGKVGAYPFTTLEPNLGEFYGYIISDIPGLIEGAGEGKGLGHKFLRHVRRTKFLLHLVSLENENPVETYKQIRKELEEFDAELTKKEEIVILTKTDVYTDEEEINKIVDAFKKDTGLSDVKTLSVYDDDSVKLLQELLLKVLKENETS